MPKGPRGRSLAITGGPVQIVVETGVPQRQA